jgi:hypothetical protein
VGNLAAGYAGIRFDVATFVKFQRHSLVALAVGPVLLSGPAAGRALTQETATEFNQEEGPKAEVSLSVNAVPFRSPTAAM